MKKLRKHFIDSFNNWWYGMPFKQAKKKRKSKGKK